MLALVHGSCRVAVTLVQMATDLPNRDIRLGEDDGRTALLVRGVVQSISPEDGFERGGYWSAMLPPVRPARALILGLGGATLAHLLARNWPRHRGGPMRIVGVDDEPQVLALARRQGWLDLPELEVVCSDAVSFVQNNRERFEYVAVDLYRGPDLERGVLTRAFLHRVRALLAPPGLIAVNLFRDPRMEWRVARLARLFAIRHQAIVGENVVIHAQAAAKRLGAPQ